MKQRGWPGSEIVLVDDGSRDRTWEMISRAAEEHRTIRGVNLSRNRGQQNALLAGLEEAKGDFVISLDADLQDDINVIRDMIRVAENGIDVALGVRKKLSLGVIGEYLEKIHMESKKRPRYFIEKPLTSLGFEFLLILRKS